MNKTIIFLLGFLLSGSSFGQSAMTALLDSILLKTRESSMYAASIPWDSLQKKVHLQAENAQTLQDLKPALETLLNGLRDHHGRFLNANNYAPIAYFTDYKNQRYKDTRTFDPDIWKVVNDTALQFEYQLLKGKVGYLKIVGIGPHVDIQKESEKIRQALVKLTRKKVQFWIIDLRYNGGGNVYPMVAGIAPLIGDGKVGKLVTANPETDFEWTIKDGNFTYDVPNVVRLPNQPQFKSLPKVAVLTSRWTVSSGEVVATIFKGRPNTRFFGESTGGYTTNTGWETIRQEIIMVISTGTFCDRNGVVYPSNIPVDEEIPFEIEENVYKDACIVAAMKWLWGK